jgi:hypothetical protein
LFDDYFDITNSIIPHDRKTPAIIYGQLINEGSELQLGIQELINSSRPPDDRWWKVARCHLYEMEQNLSGQEEQYYRGYQDNILLTMRD